nr:hypothetical protein [Tanacetum cinerariifolium]
YGSPCYSYFVRFIKGECGFSCPMSDSFGTIPTSISVIPVVPLEVAIVHADPLVAPKRPERHESLIDHDDMVSRWRDRVASRPSSPPRSSPHDTLAPSSEFPFALVVALLGFRRISHRLSDRHSSPNSTSDSSSSSSSLDSLSDTSSGSSTDSLSDSSSVHSLGCDASGSSLDSSFERSLDSSSPFVGPSRKRCRFPTTLEHMEISTADTEAVADLGIMDGVGAPTEDGIGLGVEVAASDIKVDEEEFEAEASTGGTMEIAVDPLVTGSIFESTGGDVLDLEEMSLPILPYSYSLTSSMKVLVREMVSTKDINKIDSVVANLIERMRRSRELRDACLIRPNDKPIRLILKKPTQSPIKEGRKVSMNSSTFGSVNVPVQVAKENVKALNDGESGVVKNPNTSPNTNDYATDFVKDVAANVQTACDNANGDEPNAKDTVVDHDVDTKVKAASEKVNISFASTLKHKVNRVAHIVELRNDERVEGAAVTLHLAAIEEVSSRFANTLYGYFVGKHLAYQLVENYVKNVCAYARALIEVSTDDVLKDDLVIAIPVGKDKGHSLASIRIEYEWRPSRCSNCLIFDHMDDKCPKLPKEVTPAVVIDVDTNHSKNMADDGFKVVKKKRNKKKKHQKQVDGVVLSKPSLNLHYRRVNNGNSTKQSGSNVASTSKVGKSTSTSALDKNAQLENSFSALNDNVESEWNDNTTWGKERMLAMLSLDATFSMEMFPFGHCPEGNGNVSLVMAALVIPISLDSSKESVGSHVPQVILFGTIPTSISVIPVVPLEVAIVHADPLVTPKTVSPSLLSRDPRGISLLPIMMLWFRGGGTGLHLGRPYRRDHHLTTLLHHHLNSLSDSSSVHSLGCDASGQSHSGPSTRVASPRSAPLSTPYPSTTSGSSLDLSFERSLDSSSPSARPSRKRCRFPTTLRFKDSYSPEASKEEHMEIGIADAEAVADLGIMDVVGALTEDDIGLGVKVAASDIKEDEEEFEVEASTGGRMEIAVDPLVTGGIFESTRGDVSDLEGTLYYTAYYMSEVPLDMISEFETTQRQLKAGQLMASKERADLTDKIRSLGRENLRDRDDTRRRLRRLESLVERRLGFFC